jgi:hypothetical protein
MLKKSVIASPGFNDVSWWMIFFVVQTSWRHGLIQLDAPRIRGQAGEQLGMNDIGSRIGM